MDTWKKWQSAKIVKSHLAKYGNSESEIKKLQWLHLSYLNKYWIHPENNGRPSLFIQHPLPVSCWTLLCNRETGFYQLYQTVSSGVGAYTKQSNKRLFFFRFVKMATRGKQRPRLWGRSSQHFVVKVRKNASQEIINKKPVRIWRLSFRQFHSCTRWVKRTVAACAVVWLLCVLCEGRLGFLP